MNEKPCVFLLPGLLCDDAVWTHQIAALAPGAEVHVPSFRGFNSLRAMAEHVLTLAPARFSVAGHSMGGRVVWELLALAGNRIDRVAVLDSGMHPVQPGEQEKRNILLEAARVKGLTAVAEAWIGPMLHPAHRSDPQLVADISAMILRNTVADYEGQVQALLSRQDRTPLLAGLQQKVWLIVGDEDGWSPVSQHQEMQARLKCSELRIIAQAGHMSTMEQPEAVNKVLLEWLREAPTSWMPTSTTMGIQ